MQNRNETARIIAGARRYSGPLWGLALVGFALAIIFGAGCGAKASKPIQIELGPPVDPGVAAANAMMGQDCAPFVVPEGISLPMARHAAPPPPSWDTTDPLVMYPPAIDSLAVQHLAEITAFLDSTDTTGEIRAAYEAVMGNNGWIWWLEGQRDATVWTWAPTSDGWPRLSVVVPAVGYIETHPFDR